MEKKELYKTIYSLAQTNKCTEYINLLIANYDTNKRLFYTDLIKNEPNGDKILVGINNIMSLDTFEKPKILEQTDNDILANFIHR